VNRLHCADRHCIWIGRTMVKTVLAQCNFPTLGFKVHFGCETITLRRLAMYWDRPEDAVNSSRTMQFSYLGVLCPLWLWTDYITQIGNALGWVGQWWKQFWHNVIFLSQCSKYTLVVNRLHYADRQRIGIRRKMAKADHAQCNFAISAFKVHSGCEPITLRR
jgi:hypothetical protein